MRYFDYQKVANDAEIPKDKLDKIYNAMKREFPRDEMMLELHVLRACMAVRDGHISLDLILKKDAVVAR